MACKFTASGRPPTETTSYGPLGCASPVICKKARRDSLAGLWPPVSTPFRPDGSVDEARLVRHSKQLLADGAHGLAILGTTSEANSLTNPEERSALQ